MSAAELRRGVDGARTTWLAQGARVVEVTDSTMDDAWRALDEEHATHGHLVVADHQRAGRGSHGRSWASPPGVDLYLSVVLREPAPRPTLTLAAALAIRDVVGGEDVTVKWPNDVLAGGAKIAGVLCESRSRTGQFDAVLGIGLNVNREAIPPELEATSMCRLRGEPVDRARVLCQLLEALDRWLPVPAERIAAALDACLAWRGEQVSCDEAEGTLLGVAADGGLRLRVEGVDRLLHAGRLRRAVGGAQSGR